MRASKAGPALLGAAFLALAILITPAGNAAHAQELLVMPYACSVAGGRPILTPAPEQSHAIIGQREQRSFTACSPANPAMCRTWTVHRFDLDCGGARVPWVSVVGAAAEQLGDRRAWAEDGRLRLRMGWQWGLEADDPCARGPGFDDRFGFGRMRRYCADRRAMMPPPIVEMPFGFAPMLGIDGIFVRASGPSTSQAPATLPPIVAAPAPPWAARTEQQQPRDMAANDIPARAPPPASSSPVLVPPQATEGPPRGQPGPQAAVQPVPQPVVPPAPQPAAPPIPQAKETPPKAPPTQQAAVPPPAPKPASPPAATAPAAPHGGPIVPKIINRPDAAAADTSAPASTTLPKAEPAAEPKSGVTVAPKETREDPPAGVRAEAEREDASVTMSLLSAARSPVTGAIAVFAGLTFGLLTAFVVARRRERVRFAHAGSRDVDAVWTRAKGGSPRPAPRLGFARGQVPPAAAASAMHRVPPSGQVAPNGPGVPAAWGDNIPQTRTEAMQVLGMGVTPYASDTALKKIVDGLRLTWHPDLAKDEGDRQQRELRMKQINAAWDIIQGRRGEV